MESKDWLFTIYDFEKEDLQQIHKINYKYLVIGREIQHFDGYRVSTLYGYICLNDPMKFSELEKLIEKAHVRRPYDTPQENFIYCTKGNNYSEYGTLPKKEGFKNLDKLVEMRNLCVSDDKIREKFPNYKHFCNCIVSNLC